MTVAQATWNQQQVRIDYLRWAHPQQVTRTVEPHGLVLKAGTWYLVARYRGAVRTYRISRISGAHVLEQTFDRDVEFDLISHWDRHLEEFERRRHRTIAVFRLTDRGLDLLPHVLDPVTVQATTLTATAPKVAGWTEVTIPIESIESAVPEVLRLGADLEVIAPLELRDAVVDAARRLAQVYGITGGAVEQ